MVNTIILNIGLSDRLLTYLTTTYTSAVITEKNETHVVLDVSAMTTPQQTAMKQDIASRLVEQT